MYNNIGKKIKGLAKIIGVGGIFLCSLVGIAMFLAMSSDWQTEDMAFIGLVIAVVGSLLCWLSGFFTYGFGELIDQTMDINKKLSAAKNNHSTKEKINKLKEWREKALITEEEFNEKLASL